MSKKSKKEETEVEEEEEESSEGSDSSSGSEESGSEESDAETTDESESSSEDEEPSEEEEKPKKKKVVNTNKKEETVATKKTNKTTTPVKSKKDTKPVEEKTTVTNVYMLIFGPHDSQDEPTIYFVPLATEDKTILKLLSLLESKDTKIEGQWELARVIYKVKGQGDYKSISKYEKAQEEANEQLYKLLGPFILSKVTYPIKIKGEFFFYDSRHEK